MTNYKSKWCSYRYNCLEYEPKPIIFSDKLDNDSNSVYLLKIPNISTTYLGHPVYFDSEKLTMTLVLLVREKQTDYAYTSRMIYDSNRNEMKIRSSLNEPRHEKTNILVSDLVRHKPGCPAT